MNGTVLGVNQPRIDRQIDRTSSKSPSAPKNNETTDIDQYPLHYTVALEMEKTRLVQYFLGSTRSDATSSRVYVMGVRTVYTRHFEEYSRSTYV